MAAKSILSELSDALAGAVESVGASVVRVDDGTRLTASGIIWSADGVVLATSHGVERDEEVQVELHDGRRLPAAVLGRDHDTDLAALKVEATGLPAVQRASAAEVKVGQLVLALGRPGSAGLQATVGIIGAKVETQTGGKPGYILNTDAVLYPGFSGGPLADVSGRVVGLNNLMFGRGRGVAIGTPVLEHVAAALVAHGRIRRGYLGVRTQSVAVPASLNPGQEGGALVVQVEPGSPAEQAGLLLGDTILAMGEDSITDVDDLRTVLRGRQAGDAVALRVLRGGAVKEISATLGGE